MTFDPTKYKPTQFDDSPLPAGKYLLVLETFERKIGKDSHKPYLRAKYKAITGPMKGRSFFCSLGIDLTNDGTAGRLSAFCAAANIKDRVDLASDESLKRAWCNRPFKAEVSMRNSGQYVNNDIRKYALDAKDIAGPERKAMDEWRAAFLQEQEMRGGAGSDGEDDGYEYEDDDGSLSDDDLPPF